MSKVTEQTRRESFEKIKTVTSARHKEIINLLSWHGAMTPWEIAEATGRMIHTVRPRLTELEESGHLKITGTKFQPKTDRQEAVYALNPREELF